ncbi:unnamed protein product [Spirodela intermedia]|uniref:Protein-lysine N-methyltransferase SI7747_10013529 n=1 Tax=Spirodela intermedia TaxID=51605 RepID=A0A7I8JA91_SPIIN|nr:unnamed protein product [Spirodela intermedia]CAA6667136.1 unnamed protein product [Spirodela intermedia]
MAVTGDDGERAAATLEAVEGEEDDSRPLLSARALEALTEFLANSRGCSRRLLVSEDWRLSQFWYDPDTARTVAEEIMVLCAAAGSSCLIGCIACPTIYTYLKKMNPSIAVHLLEFDRRFEQYGADFTFYDYNQPYELPSVMRHAYQVVIADPPYLSQECLEKVARTVSFLARPEESYLLLLTGEVQEERALELLKLRPCGFRPRHSSKLGNEFRIFTSYDPQGRLGGWA